MSDFTENIRTAYEQYIQGNKEEAFSMLMPGTKHYYYLLIIDSFKTINQKVRIIIFLKISLKRFASAIQNILMMEIIICLSLN